MLHSSLQHRFEATSLRETQMLGSYKLIYLSPLLTVLEATFGLTMTCEGSSLLYLILIYIYFFCFIKPLTLNYV